APGARPPAGVRLARQHDRGAPRRRARGRPGPAGTRRQDGDIDRDTEGAGRRHRARRPAPAAMAAARAPAARRAQRPALLGHAARPARGAGADRDRLVGPVARAAGLLHRRGRPPCPVLDLPGTHGHGRRLAGMVHAGTIRLSTRRRPRTGRSAEAAFPLLPGALALRAARSQGLRTKALDRDVGPAFGADAVGALLDPRERALDRAELALVALRLARVDLALGHGEAAFAGVAPHAGIPGFARFLELRFHFLAHDSRSFTQLRLQCLAIGRTKAHWITPIIPRTGDVTSIDATTIRPIPRIRQPGRSSFRFSRSVRSGPPHR